MGQLDLAYCFHRQHLLVSLHGVQSNDLEGLAGDGQFSMPITARGGSLLHADSHSIYVLFAHSTEFASIIFPMYIQKVPSRPRRLVLRRCCFLAAASLDTFSCQVKDNEPF